MKNRILAIGLILLIGAIFTPVHSAVSDTMTTTVECPEGDRYLCYSNSDGLNVRKGKGIAIVTIAP
jgi:hypothetical protein